MLSECVNVILGLIFVYLAFALLASRVNEFIANLLQWRAAGLAKGLAALVGGPAPLPGPAVARFSLSRRSSALPELAISTQLSPQPLLSAVKVKQHPLVASIDLGIERRRSLSYLSGETFATAVVDILSSAGAAPGSAPIHDLGAVTPVLNRVDKQHLTQTGREAYVQLLREPSAAHLRAFADALHPGDIANLAIVGELTAFLPSTLDRVRDALTRLEAEHNPATEALRSLIASAGNDLDALSGRLGSWFDAQMQRVGGAYKRRVQRWILAYAILLVLAFNVDTIGIAKDLWLSPVHRAAVAEVAGKAATEDLGTVEADIDQLPGLALPLGWDLSQRPASATTAVDDSRRLPGTVGGWLLKLVGLFLSAVAINFGAPFWFDTLGKLANMRNSGRPPAANP